MATSTKHFVPDLPMRLKALRHMVSGENQTTFAAKIGIEVKRWNNFERGSPLSKEIAILLVQNIPGLTLDWLFLGKEDGLTRTRQAELADALKAIADAGKLTTSATGTRR